MNGVPYPRANPVDADHLPGDVWAAAQLPVGLRLEFVGDAEAVRISYETATGNLGYRGEGAGCSFVVYRATQKVSEVEAVLGEGVVELELFGDPNRPSVVYLPEGMRPTVRTIEPVGGTIEPAPRQPRWLAYGDAATQGWLASSPAMAWPAVAGRKLGLDVCNLGYAGSARGETSSAVMLADTAAEVISVSFGANSWSRVPHNGALMAAEVDAFLDLVRGGHPDTPIVVVSPTVRPDAEDTPNRLGATLGELRRAMEDAVRSRAEGDAGLFLVEGARILGAEDLEDGVYPGDEGHKRLAAAVSKHISPMVSDLRQRALARRQEETLAASPAVLLDRTGAIPSGTFSPSTGALVDGVEPGVVARVVTLVEPAAPPAVPAASAAGDGGRDGTVVGAGAEAGSFPGGQPVAGGTAVDETGTIAPVVPIVVPAGDAPDPLAADPGLSAPLPGASELLAAEPIPGGPSSAELSAELSSAELSSAGLSSAGLSSAELSSAGLSAEPVPAEPVPADPGPPAPESSPSVAVSAPTGDTIQVELAPAVEISVPVAPSEPAVGPTPVHQANAAQAALDDILASAVLGAAAVPDGGSGAGPGVDPDAPAVDDPAVAAGPAGAWVVNHPIGDPITAPTGDPATAPPAAAPSTPVPAAPPMPGPSAGAGYRAPAAPAAQTPARSPAVAQEYAQAVASLQTKHRA